MADLKSLRVFKIKWFKRWSRKEGISDEVLYKAASDVVEGKGGADLGGSLFKIRIAKAGAGKSTGYRVILGYKKPKTGRVLFLYGFEKSEKSNISAVEEKALSIAAEAFSSATDEQIQRLIAKGSIEEVKNE